MPPTLEELPRSPERDYESSALTAERGARILQQDCATSDQLPAQEACHIPRSALPNLDVTLEPRGSARQFHFCLSSGGRGFYGTKLVKIFYEDAQA
jgi:hypothetical protein